ncbi:MAG: HD domain-containing protein [Kiritimatiellia bacterium]|jgi:hypothetical protein|nr:HD domain-containing protein [Kiritimatiellia bacterium]
MTNEQLHPIPLWVEAYVEQIYGTGNAVPAALALKLEHTRLVAANAREIARQLEWPVGDVRLGEALGWLHDVGRFAQFAEFGHYHDAASFNHGLRGAEIVAESGLLASLPPISQACLLDSIRHHNAKTIPPDVAATSLPFLKLIRDADKLDIFRVVIDGLERDGFRELAAMWPHIDLDGPINSRLLHEIRANHQADLVHVRSLADFLILLASWMLNLNYAPSRQLMQERGVLDTLEIYLPPDPAVREFIQEMRGVHAQQTANGLSIACAAHAG